VVLEKSQFVDKETLQKYLKGRQREGLTDNLPVVSGTRGDDSDGHFASGDGADRELIYRALLELQNDMGDLKKMLAKFLYSTFSSKEIRALPPAIQRNIDPNDVNSTMYGDFRPAGKQNEDEFEENRSKNDFEQFFENQRIPSIEETEKFLIEQALKRFEGNRRKASETLGISERTLYRKLDQYDLA
jgi:DNA-binding NtrC family response regulator